MGLRAHETLLICIAKRGEQDRGAAEQCIAAKIGLGLAGKDEADPTKASSDPPMTERPIFFFGRGTGRKKQRNQRRDEGQGDGLAMGCGRAPRRRRYPDGDDRSARDMESQRARPGQPLRRGR